MSSLLESESKLPGRSTVIRYNRSIYRFKRYVIFLCVVGYCCLHEIWLWEFEDFPREVVGCMNLLYELDLQKYSALVCLVFIIGTSCW
jgi:hypothetical protein